MTAFRFVSPLFLSYQKRSFSFSIPNFPVAVSFFFMYFLVSNACIFSQAITVKQSSYFGVQIKPIFPGVFIGTTQFDNNAGDFHTVFSQSTGRSFGGIVRFGLTRLLSIETGIHFTQRNYTFQSSLADSNLFVDGTMRYITYDIPVSLLVYLPLSDNFFVNTSFGFGVFYSISGIGKRIAPANTRHTISQLGIGKKLIAETVANFGFEYRNVKKGTFYLGVAARIPFSPLFYLRSKYQNQGLIIQTDPSTQGRVNGSYIALELKYFFPLIKSKGSPIKSPIE